MSLELVRSEIERFLSVKTPEVLCLTGKWGVGKTYAWKSFLRDAQRRKKIALKKYAYVSLFGLANIEDVKTSIVENTIDSSVIDAKPDLTSLQAISQRLVDGFKHTAAELSRYAKNLPVGSSYVLSANRILFTLTSEQIICIDDLERAGKDLDAKNVMGLASALKEEKNCKIVILLNQDALAPGKKDDFTINLEKVADIVIRFDPTPAEAADIAVDSLQPFEAWLREDIIALKITNIRVIKRIEKFCKQVFSVTQGADARTLRQIVHTIALAVYAKFQPEIAPSLEYIENYNSISDIISKKDGKRTGQDEEFAKVLRGYGFSNVSEFDKIFINLVRSGVVDVDAVSRDVVQSTEKWELSARRENYLSVWKVYNSSFSIDEQIVLRDIFDLTSKHIADITAGELSAAVAFLKEFDKKDEASELIQKFIHIRTEPSTFWDLTDIGNMRQVSDPDVRQAFQKRFDETFQQKSLKETCMSLSVRNGWDDGVLDTMVSADQNTYIEMFKTASENDFLSIIQGALFFRNTSSPDIRLKQITDKVLSALNEIALENRLNAKRVKMLLS